MVGLADEEVHVKVGEIHLGDIVVVSKELPHGVQPLHLEVLVLGVLVGSVGIVASTRKVDERPKEVSSSLTKPILRHMRHYRPLPLPMNSSNMEQVLRGALALEKQCFRTVIRYMDTIDGSVEKHLEH